MSSDTPITVALVEDQRGLRDSMQDIFARVPDIRCVAACSNAEQALAELPALAPKVVFMDINLPRMDGVACVKELSPRMPDTLFIMLTVQDNTSAVFNSLAAGACGYLRKPVTATQLAEAVKEVVSGGSPMSAPIARLVVRAFKNTPPVETRAQSAPPAVNLTPREQEVLDLLVEGYDYKTIADKMKVSIHTVHFHIQHTYRKLQVRSRGEAVAKVRNL
ncbi:response regulator transcription factor [Novosphingobium sp.]|uniref:response regulator n=1 Tax=Novosphingobium sp. TaxID=1874826 RepID=UPI00263328B4|nr:response regulator transcription factor [Novosphingobium sp.]